MEFIQNVYFDPITNNYPVTAENGKELYPNVSFPTNIGPDIFTFLGLELVGKVVKPQETSELQVIAEGIPKKDGNFYVQNWEIFEYGSDEAEHDLYAAIAKQEKLQEISKFRYALEVGGITVDGMHVKTDRESQAQLASALMMINQGFASQINWKSESGWISLDKNKILVLSKAVALHVQGCFNIEQFHVKRIEALSTFTAVKTYDFSSKWPSTKY